MNQFAKNLGKAEMQLLASFWTFAVREGKCMGYEPISRCPTIFFAENESWKLRSHFFPILYNSQGALIAYWAVEHGDPNQTCLVYIIKNKTATVFAKSISDFLSVLLYGNDFLENILYAATHQECLNKLCEYNRANYKEYTATENWLNKQQISTSKQPQIVVETAKNAYPNLEDWLRKELGEHLFPNSLN